MGLEPSCVSVFRDEMTNLLAGDEDAQRLTQLSKTLSELLLANDDWKPPRLNGKAVLHTHCHHKVLDLDAEIKILKAMGLEVEQPSLGCCGHAGSFGYEIEHYPISVQIGEQVLLPKIRNTSRDTIIVADGFSCRQQIKDGANRWAMHPAEVIALAIESAGRPPQPVPEHRYLESPATPNKTVLLATAIGSCDRRSGGRRIGGFESPKIVEQSEGLSSKVF